MANAILTQSPDLTNPQTKQQNIQFIVEDGVHFNDDPAVNEWEVWIDGEPVAWASTQSQAWRSYHEMLRVEREHVERNPANAESSSILVNNTVTGQVTVLEMTPLYDLVVASAKYGAGLTSSPKAPIKWFKQAGFPQRSPLDKNTALASPQVQAFLQGYELVDIEVKQFEVIRKYRKLVEVA